MTNEKSFAFHSVKYKTKHKQKSDKKFKINAGLNKSVPRDIMKKPNAKNIDSGKAFEESVAFICLPSRFILQFRVYKLN